MLADFLARLQLTRPEVLRVTKARNVLWRFGKVLREGSTGRNLYGHSCAAGMWFLCILLLAQSIQPLA